MVTVRSSLVKLLGWRLLLTLTAAAAPLVLAYQPSFPYAELFPEWFGAPRWVTAWANFDGVHYYTIATSGYLGTGLVQAFFPAYPLLVRALHQLGVPVLAAALLISHLSLWAALITLHRLIRLDFSTKIARWSVLFLLAFPTSFFFGSFYSESLFLLAALVSLYQARQGRWRLAGLAAGVASATRIVGIALVPALLVELAIQERLLPKYGYHFEWRPAAWARAVQGLFKRRWRSLWWIAAGGLGVLGFMLFLSIQFNDPLYLLSVQAEFGGGRQESLVAYPQVVWRYTKILTTGSVSGVRLWSTVQEMIAGVVAVVGLGLAALKIRWSYILFAGIAILLPTLTGTFSSMPRYILVAFPLYIGLALVTKSRPELRWTILSISGLLLVMNTLLFSQGYWVA